MPAKAKAKSRKMKKPVKKVNPAKMKKGSAYECKICGFRIVVDEVCGCAEEHVFVCCGKAMKEAKGKKIAKKKASTKTAKRAVKKPARKAARKKKA